MSTERGNIIRTRAQKYTNSSAFRNDMHDRTPKQIMLNKLHISEVCQHCKEVIEWKIKYKKYKPLSQPKTCTRCQQRTIRKAYHVLCTKCARDTNACAKCLKRAGEVEIEPATPTLQEEIKLKVEMERLIKSFPERKRRAFLRYMKRGKKVNDEEGAVIAEDSGKALGNQPNVDEIHRHIPHSRDELLKKIEELKLSTDETNLGFDSDDFDESEEGSSSSED